MSIKHLLPFSAFFFYSCSYLKDQDSTLGLKKVANNSDIIKLDGYYYTTDSTSKSSENNDVFFLFRNGVFFSPGWFSDEQLQNMEVLLMKEPERSANRDVKWMWGLYEIKDSSFVVEKWNPSSGGYSTLKMFGMIVNDSTVAIKGILPLDAADTAKTDIYYRFRRVRIKPDSANNFIP